MASPSGLIRLFHSNAPAAFRMGVSLIPKRESNLADLTPAHYSITVVAGLAQVTVIVVAFSALALRLPPSKPGKKSNNRCRFSSSLLSPGSFPEYRFPCGFLPSTWKQCVNRCRISSLFPWPLQADALRFRPEGPGAAGLNLPVGFLAVSFLPNHLIFGRVNLRTTT